MGDAMQNRHVGDIGDYVKYGLLRALVAEDQQLGVAWYLFPDESGTDDGRRTQYLQDPAWRRRDPELFDTLKGIVDEDRRCVDAIKRSGILREAKFSDEVLSAPEATGNPAQWRQRRSWRVDWFKGVAKALQGCDVVFVDPDNGLCKDESFKPSGAKKNWKRLPLHEAKALGKDRTAIICHHNTRNKGGNRVEIDRWMERLGSDTLALWWHGKEAKSNRTFFVVNPTPAMEGRLREFASKWEPNTELIPGMVTSSEQSISDLDGRLLSDEKEMTLSEMKSRFHSEWILIGDPDTDSALNVLRGRVLCHSKDRDEVYRVALALPPSRRPSRSALMYTGRIPEDAAVIL